MTILACDCRLLDMDWAVKADHTCCWPAAAAMLIQSGCMPALAGICENPPLPPALPVPLWKG